MQAHCCDRTLPYRLKDLYRGADFQASPAS
jgi:hypothetical protein